MPSTNPTLHNNCKTMEVAVVAKSELKLCVCVFGGGGLLISTDNVLQSLLWEHFLLNVPLVKGEVLHDRDTCSNL